MIFLIYMLYFYPQLMLALLRFMARSERIHPTLRKTAILLLIS